MTQQDKVFAGGEGDRWFERNQAVLSRADALATDPLLRVIQLANLKPKRAIEIGASNGFRLDLLQQLYGCEAVGVEPSEAAIAQGRAAYPKVQFLQGVAGALPIEQDAGFDLVVVSSVFHWVDRSTLLRSCAEADRMLADGGFLVIGDFYPALPERVNYHHRTDVELYTYKQNYAEIFLATRLYTQFASLAFARQGWVCRPDVEASDRYQVCALKKTGQEGYLPKEFKP